MFGSRNSCQCQLRPRRRKAHAQPVRGYVFVPQGESSALHRWRQTIHQVPSTLPPVRYGHYGTVAERQISPFTQSKAVLSITAQRETDPLFLLHFSASGIARQMRHALLFHSNWGEEIVSFPSQRVGNSCCLLSPTPWRKEKKVYACGQYKYFLAASSKVQHWVCPKRGTGVRKVRLFTEHAS